MFSIPTLDALGFYCLLDFLTPEFHWRICPSHHRDLGRAFAPRRLGLGEEGDDGDGGDASTIDDGEREGLPRLNEALRPDRPLVVALIITSSDSSSRKAVGILFRTIAGDSLSCSFVDSSEAGDIERVLRLLRLGCVEIPPQMLKMLSSDSL